MISICRLFKRKKMGYIELKRSFFTKEYSIILPDIAISKITYSNKYQKGESDINEYIIQFSSVEYLLKVVNKFQNARGIDFVANFENKSINYLFVLNYLQEKS